jgi:hypothetical protein
MGMTVVVSFWRFPEEEEAFLDFLDKTGNVVAIPYQNFHNLEAIKPQPLREMIKNSDLNSASHSLLIGLEHWMDQIRVNPYFHNGGNIFAVSYLYSPLIVYDRGQFREPNKLGMSNLCTTRSYYDDGKKLIYKPDEFVKWGKKVFSWVRKETPEFHQYKTYRLTLRVAEAVRNNLIDIVP